MTKLHSFHRCQRYFIIVDNTPSIVYFPLWVEQPLMHRTWCAESLILKCFGKNFCYHENLIFVPYPKITHLKLSVLITRSMGSSFDGYFEMLFIPWNIWSCTGGPWFLYLMIRWDMICLILRLPKLPHLCFCLTVLVFPILGTKVISTLEIVA